jgi:fibronectin-binding autotransporter adhesin
MPTGTVTTGSLSNIAMLHAGTIASVGTLIGIGTVSNTVTTSGTVTGVGTVSGIVTTSGTVTGVGVVTSVTDVANLAKGTVTSVGSVVGIGTVSNTVTTSGTVTGVGVVSAITTGSLTNIAMVHGGTHVHPTGTLTTGSLANVAMLHGGTLATSGTTTGVGVVSALTNGSVNILTGTIQSSGTTTGVGTITSQGTLYALLHGTIDAGTVKINATPAGSTILTNHVLGTSGAALFGTLLATAGAGTNVYLTGLQIVVHSGTPDCAITNNVAGSTGAGVYARGIFPPGGGIARDFSPAINCGAAGTLCYYINTGTASFIVNYWVSP